MNAACHQYAAKVAECDLPSTGLDVYIVAVIGVLALLGGAGLAILDWKS